MLLAKRGPQLTVWPLIVRLFHGAIWYPQDISFLWCLTQTWSWNPDVLPAELMKKKELLSQHETGKEGEGEGAHVSPAMKDSKMKERGRCGGSSMGSGWADSMPPGMRGHCSSSAVQNHDRSV